jgi:hypothetical protein
MQATKEKTHIWKIKQLYTDSKTGMGSDLNLSNLPNDLTSICFRCMDSLFFKLHLPVQNNIREINQTSGKHFKVFRIMLIYFLTCLSLVRNMAPIFSTTVHHGETVGYLLLGSLPLTSCWSLLNLFQVNYNL